MNTYSSNKVSRGKITLLGTCLKTLMICLLTMSFAQQAHAQYENANSNTTKGKWIVGLKAAQVELSGLNTDAATLEEADAFGIVVGYEFNKSIGRTNGTASFEVELLTTSDTSIEQLDSSFGEYNADIINAFFGYRSSGQVFFKAKGGISYVDASTNFNVFAPGVPADIQFDDFSFAGGFGVGVRLGKERVRGIIELEYTGTTGDAEVEIISLNGLVNF